MSNNHTKLTRPQKKSGGLVAIAGLIIAFISIPWWPQIIQKFKVPNSKDQQIQSNLSEPTPKPSTNIDINTVRPLEVLETGKHIGELPNGVYFFASPYAIEVEIKDPSTDFLAASTKMNHGYSFEIQKIQNRYLLIGFISEESYSKLGSISTNNTLFTMLFPNQWGGARYPIAVPFDQIYAIKNRTVDLDENTTVDIFDIGFKEVIDGPISHIEL